MTKDKSATLKLVAFDADDLAVVSALLQDAVAKVGDMAYLPDEKRFVMVLNRFDWTGSEREGPVRRRTGVHFERVFAAKTRDVDLAAHDAVVNLLAVEFEEKAPPAGVVTLLFSGDAAIRLEVECLEAALSDLGPPWPTQKRPRHEA
ncbi:MAG TPA: DUF2948 family protein [Xanthobacteraceae bacterium]|nr:DUF2948 family protein [Xanthobacteraceae bacterium]